MDTDRTLTLQDLVPGKMGRVVLTRVALRLRRPELLQLKPTEPLGDELARELIVAIAAVARG